MITEAANAKLISHVQPIEMQQSMTFIFCRKTVLNSTAMISAMLSFRELSITWTKNPIVGQYRFSMNEPITCANQTSIIYIRILVYIFLARVRGFLLGFQNIYIRHDFIAIIILR